MKVAIIAVMMTVLGICLVVSAINWHPEDSVVLIYNDVGHGSGAIIGPDMVLTTKHVAIEAGMRVQDAKGRTYEVRYVEFDADDDLAVLHIYGKFPQKPLALCRTPFKRGELIHVVGTPYERDLMNCVFSGHVVKTDFNVQQYENLDVIDAHVGRGCSGGPVLDLRGRVRGVVAITYGSLSAAVPVEELDG